MMKTPNHDYQPSGSLRDSLLDALLQAVYEKEFRSDGESVHGNRITTVMNQIRTDDRPRHDERNSLDEMAEPAISLRGSAKSPDQKRLVPWGVATAALVAVAIATLFFNGSRQAMAAIDRSIAATQHLITRQYRVTASITNRNNQARDLVSDLYVQGNERFALRHPSPLVPGKSFWLGSDGEESWFVPLRGPVRTGDDTGLARWIQQREQLSTPRLQLDTILARMKRGYQLDQKPEVLLQLNHGIEVNCLHIVGRKRVGVNENKPRKIELWCDAETGTVMRLILTHGERQNPGKPRKISLVYDGSPDVDDDWFSAKGHSRPGRRILRFESSD